MSSGFMDTQPGGESTQSIPPLGILEAKAHCSPRYESIQTVTDPHSKQGGQMGGECTAVIDVDMLISCQNPIHKQMLWTLGWIRIKLIEVQRQPRT